MRLTFHLILILALTERAFTQPLTQNTCDSSILTKQELEKCKSDTIFNTDLLARIDYITFLKTELLPKYRLKRNSIIIPAPLVKDIKRLKRIYDSTLTHKLSVFYLEMDRNQKFVQPKGYISSLLSLETFRFYPDVSAVLLNEIHLELNPKTTSLQIQQVKQLVQQIVNSLSADLKHQVLQLTNNLIAEKKKYPNSSSLELFQGAITDEQRKLYNIINFLLWTE